MVETPLEIENTSQYTDGMLKNLFFKYTSDCQEATKNIENQQIKCTLQRSYIQVDI